MKISLSTVCFASFYIDCGVLHTFLLFFVAGTNMYSLLKCSDERSKRAEYLFPHQRSPPELSANHRIGPTDPRLYRHLLVALLFLHRDEITNAASVDFGVCTYVFQYLHHQLGGLLDVCVFHSLGDCRRQCCGGGGAGVYHCVLSVLRNTQVCYITICSNSCIIL